MTRQEFSDVQDIQKALSAAKMTGMDVLGFVFYGERLNEDSLYSRKNYSEYYHKYDYRSSAKDGQKAELAKKG